MFNSYVSLPEGNTIRSSSKYVKQIIQWIGINRNKSRNKQAVLLKSQNEVGIQETSRNKICFSATGQPSQGVPYLDSSFLNGQKHHCTTWRSMGKRGTSLHFFAIKSALQSSATALLHEVQWLLQTTVESLTSQFVLAVRSLWLPSAAS
jgi:hypothetical protein